MNDEAGLLERVLLRWSPDDQALYYAALAYLRDSTQSLAALADGYAEEYHAVVWPRQVEELAGELYAAREIETANTIKREGEA